MRLPFRLLNVFARAGDPFSGNPLCVFEDGSGARGGADAGPGPAVQPLRDDVHAPRPTATGPTPGADLHAELRDGLCRPPDPGDGARGRGTCSGSATRCGCPCRPVSSRWRRTGEMWTLTANEGRVEREFDPTRSPQPWGWAGRPGWSRPAGQHRQRPDHRARRVGGRRAARRRGRRQDAAVCRDGHPWRRDPGLPVGPDRRGHRRGTGPLHRRDRPPWRTPQRARRAPTSGPGSSPRARPTWCGRSSQGAQVGSSVHAHADRDRERPGAGGWPGSRDRRRGGRALTCLPMSCS